MRQDGARRSGSTAREAISVTRALTVLGVGYVLGTKAGRERGEQIAATARAITQSPATKSVIDAGRRKIAERCRPIPGSLN